MLDRFTDRARKVMSMAKQEALDLHSNKVGTEHLLLALAKEDEGIAAEALRSLDISYDDIMDTLKEVQTTVPEPSEETEAAKLAFTPLVISVMERSFRVARENNQTYVSTEHLLIGIVEEGNGMAMDILMRLGVSSASIKKAIEKLTAKDQDKKRPLAGAGAGRPGGSPRMSGLFLVRRERISIIRWTSFSRPITGSSSPSRAFCVRLVANCLSVSVPLPFC